MPSGPTSAVGFTSPALFLSLGANAALVSVALAELSVPLMLTGAGGRIVRDVSEAAVGVAMIAWPLLEEG